VLAAASRRTEPGRPASRRRTEMTRQDDAALVERLEALCGRWEKNEGKLRERDRRGIRLFRDELWERGLGAGKLEITANTPLGLFERVAAEVLRGQPEPEIEAIDPDAEDAARVAQGAIRTNWRYSRVREKLGQAYRLAGFTRPVAFYHYWDQEAHGGLGDVNKRLVPGFRLIIDDRMAAVGDMEFVGFEEEMSRAKLITLFPSKAKEIEAAAEAAGSKPANITNDPLKPNTGGVVGANMVVDRLIAQGALNTPPYTPATSIKGPQRSKGDPLTEKVTVRFVWTRDPTPVREKRPRLDPKTKRQMYQLVRDDDGAPQFEEGDNEIVDTPLGPMNVPMRTPKTEIVMDDVIVLKYKHWRHTAYIPTDSLVLWDVSWDGPVPLSVLRDRYPAYGFDAPGTALRLATLASARNILWTFIFESLKKSQAGNWIASSDSQLKLNKVTNEIGNIYYVRGEIDKAIKEFPRQPLGADYFGLLDKIEAEMELLIGVTPMMKGQAVGRADSPQTYEQVAEQSGGPILDRAKLVDQWISDAAEIDLWFMQNNYTHEHVVEAETAEGFATWTEASVLTLRGKFAVRVETAATLGRSQSRARQEAQEGSQIGLYPLPMQAQLGQYRNWRQGIKQRAAIMKMGPQYGWLLGAAGAPPTQQAMNQRVQQGKRSHHTPGGK
jgi:hypothetical protein